MKTETSTESPFSPIERELLKGLSSKVGTKRGCRKEYVNKIIAGTRPVSTETAKNVYADLLEILDVLTIKVA